MDNDAYGHVNNVVYYSWFDTVVNAHLIEQGVLDIHQGETIGLVIETQCNYFRVAGVPAECGSRLARGHMGTSSVRYEVGLFAQGEPLTAAKGHFIHVYVDKLSRRPVPLPNKLKTVLEQLNVTQSQVSTVVSDPASVDAAIESRFSVRAFLPTPVSRELIERHPAGGQPRAFGHQHPALEGLCAAGRQPRWPGGDKVCAAHDAICMPTRRWPRSTARNMTTTPSKWVSPYIDRRRENGWGLYGLLGITKGDKDRCMRSTSATSGCSMRPWG
jgi:acyl-CoA thioester hydrolase